MRHKGPSSLLAAGLGVALGLLPAANGYALETEQQLLNTNLTQSWQELPAIGAPVGTQGSEGEKGTELSLDSIEVSRTNEISKFLKTTSTVTYQHGSPETYELYVDEAVAVLGLPDSPMHLTVGKTALPFASANGTSWSNPLTDDILGDPQNIAIVTAAKRGLSTNVYVYEGDQEEVEQTQNFGLNLDYETDNNVTLGAGYLNNLYPTDPTVTTDEIAAVRLSAGYQINNLALSTSLLQVNTLDTIGSMEPNAALFSTDYDLESVFGTPGRLVIDHTIADETDATGLAQQRTAAGVSRTLGKGTDMTIKYVREEEAGSEPNNSLNLILESTF